MNRETIIAAMELSAIAYIKTQPQYDKTILSIIDDSETGVQCYIRRKKNILTITFRGSDSLKDWKTDFTFWKKTIPYGNFLSPIRVHKGFLNAYKSPNVRDVIQSNVSDEITKIELSGHSYGAALAVLCAVDLEYNFPNKDIEVILFGCPRVGNRAFVKSYNQRVFKTYRVENGNDMVTKVPFTLWGFHHVGIRIHIGFPRIFGFMSFRAHDKYAYYRSLIKGMWL